MHVVDELILERCEKLQQNVLLWPYLQPLLYSMLGYKQARAMADMIADGTGNEAFTHVSQLLALSVPVTGLEYIPKKGRCIIIGNHPTGLADGIVVYDALHKTRPDMMFMANADAMRAVPAADDIIIPVEWVLEKRSRETARQTLQGVRNAMSEERCVVIFPSGSLAQFVPGCGLVDRPWEISAVSLAKKYDAPVIPMNLGGRNSILYYLFCLIHKELRDITLFHELLNKKNHSLPVTFGTHIPSSELSHNNQKATEHIRKIVTKALAETE